MLPPRKTAKNHEFRWKLIAFSDTKSLFVCGCASTNTQPLRGCGAVGIQRGRGDIVVIRNPEFEDRG